MDRPALHHEAWCEGNHVKEGLPIHAARTPRKIQWWDENGSHGQTPTHLLDEEGLDVGIFFL